MKTILISKRAELTIFWGLWVIKNDIEYVDINQTNGRSGHIITVFVKLYQVAIAEVGSLYTTVLKKHGRVPTQNGNINIWCNCPQYPQTCFFHTKTPK